MDVIYPYKIISTLLQSKFLDAQKYYFSNVQFATQDKTLFFIDPSFQILSLSTLLLLKALMEFR